MENKETAVHLCRSRGVLMHVSSLPGRYGCGSFGRSAADFIDKLSASGYRYWQTLPFGMPDRDGSPYKSFSAFAGNPLFIDIDSLYAEGLLTAEELESEAERCAQMTFSCCFEVLTPGRFALLRRASERVRDREKIESFISAHRELEHFCVFMADKHRGYPAAGVNIDREAELFFYKFTQYCFFTQWKKIHRYAHKKGVLIIGDIPIYVDIDSADVEYYPELFLLDSERRPEAVSGVPPDYFSPDGQKWGNPLYDWEKMKEDGFRWWLDRIRWQFKIFDGLRIDHFRGLSAFYAIPAGDPDAKRGKWIKGPGMELVDGIKSVAGGRLVIAEDLGDIDDAAAELVRKSGFPGMRVFQFAFLGKDSPHLPHNYPENCVAYTGTHDNTTLLAYIYELDPATRNLMLDYIGYSGDPLKCGDAVMRAVSRSHARTVIFPIQDILGFGSDTRMNIPGKPSGNWSFRVTKDQLDSIDVNYRRFLGFLYSR